MLIYYLNSKFNLGAKMQLTLSGNQLLVSYTDLDFFQKIKNNGIPLNINMNNSISDNILGNKKIDVQCPDMTKIAILKNDLSSCPTNKVKIKNITIELECA
jgi:hypothetical protein